MYPCVPDEIVDAVVATLIGVVAVRAGVSAFACAKRDDDDRVLDREETLDECLFDEVLEYVADELMPLLGAEPGSLVVRADFTSDERTVTWMLLDGGGRESPMWLAAQLAFDLEAKRDREEVQPCSS